MIESIITTFIIIYLNSSTFDFNANFHYSPAKISKIVEQQIERTEYREPVVSAHIGQYVNIARKSNR